MNFILRSQRAKSNPNGRVSFFDASEYNAFVIAYRSGDTLPPFSIHDLLWSYKLEDPRLNPDFTWTRLPTGKEVELLTERDVAMRCQFINDLASSGQPETS